MYMRTEEHRNKWVKQTQWFLFCYDIHVCQWELRRISCSCCIFLDLPLLDLTCAILVKFFLKYLFFSIQISSAFFSMHLSTSPKSTRNKQSLEIITVPYFVQGGRLLLWVCPRFLQFRWWVGWIYSLPDLFFKGSYDSWLCNLFCPKGHIPMEELNHLRVGCEVTVRVIPYKNLTKLTAEIFL